MFTFPWAQKDVFGSVDCSNDVFGDVARGKPKQCYCEAEMEGPTIEQCGSEGDECVCLGKVYYGLQKMGKHSSPIPFAQMIRKPHKVADSHGSIQCNNGVFGDPTPGAPKQCFCEAGAPVTKSVLKCGEEGEDCQCNGNVFYGAAVVQDKAADFESMLTKQFKVRPSKESMKCNNAHFGDPLPGTPKACFCDDVHKMSRDQIKLQ